MSDQNNKVTQDEDKQIENMIAQIRAILESHSQTDKVSFEETLASNFRKRSIFERTFDSIKAGIKAAREEFKSVGVRMK